VTVCQYDFALGLCRFHLDSIYGENKLPASTNETTKKLIKFTNAIPRLLLICEGVYHPGGYYTGWRV